MKYRNGFVSNSSSSSFIIGLANVTTSGRTDLDAMTVIFDSAKISSDKGYGKTYEIKDTWVYVYNNTDGTYTLKIESFLGSDVMCTVNNGDKVIMLNSYGPNDDSFFYEDEDDGYCDYDKIDLGDFSEADIEIYKTIQSIGGDVHYGAGRDG